MPADNTLNFTTNVDLTGMNTGLDAAQGKVEEFSAATQASVLAVDAVWDVFVEKNAAGLTAFDEILEHHITRTAEYEAAMEAQIATAEAAAEATANQGIAQTILSELTAKRTQQEINTNNAMRGAYAAAAERTAFAISSNADYAASVQAITAAYSELIATQATVPAGVAAGAAGAVAVEDVAATGGAAAAQAAIAEKTAAATAAINEQKAAFAADMDAAVADAAAMESNATANEAAATATAATSAETIKASTYSTEYIANSERQTIAVNAYTIAAAKGTAAQKILGAAFDQAIATGATSTEAMEAAVAAVNNATAANAANTASLNFNTEAENLNAAAAYNRSEAFGTARISAGLAAGSLTGVDYGLARIAASSQIVGPLLQAIMPLAIFAAASYMVVEFGEYLYKAFDLGGQGAYELQKRIQDLDLDMQHINDQILLQTERMKDQIAKLEHKPFNGLQLALLEAAAAADSLNQKLDATAQKELVALKTDLSKGGYAPTTAQSIFGDRGTHDEEVAWEQHNIHLHQAKNLQDQLAESTRFMALESKHLNDLQVEQDNAEALRGSRLNIAGTMVFGDYKDKIAATQGILEQTKSQIEAAQNLINQGETQKQLDVLKGDKLPKGPDPDVKKLQGIEYLLKLQNEAEAKLTGHGLTAGEAASFWEQYLNTFKAKKTEATRVLEEYTRSVEENHKKLQEGLKKASEVQGQLALMPQPKSDEELDKINLKISEDLFRTGERWHEYNKYVAEVTEIQDTNTDSMARAALTQAKALGSITALGSAQAAAALDADEYAKKLKALQKELVDLQNAAKLIAAPGGAMQAAGPGYEQNQTQQASLKNQIAKLQGQQAVAAITDNGRVAQEIVAPYERAFKTIESDFFKAQQSIINGTQSVSRAFGKMGIDILESVEEAAEKMVLTWAAQEAKMLILHVFTNQAKVASDATAAAQSATISKASKLREIFGDAKAAAAGAYKAMAGIPVVGPELGAIAAAVTFAAVMALGAFDQGGIIPGSGAVPILGHGGERVLTQSQTNTFERMVNNPGATSNTTHNHLHYNGQVNAYDRTGMRSTLRSHADDLLDIVQEGWNSGKLRRT